MAVNKFKQNLRYQKVCERLDKKVRYNGFTMDEVKVIKTQQRYEQMQKELNRFWATAPRLKNGHVDWENMSEQQLDYFEYINNESEKLQKRLSKYEDKGFSVDNIMIMFMRININSVSY